MTQVPWLCTFGVVDFLENTESIAIYGKITTIF